MCSSFNSLFNRTRATLQGAPDFLGLCWFPVSPEKRANLESTSANCISARRYIIKWKLFWFHFNYSVMSERIFCSVVRCRIYYILICGVSSRPALTLCAGHNSSKLKTYNPSNQLQWLINFSRKAQARGDVVRHSVITVWHHNTAHVFVVYS